jgi:transposase-like protein
MATDNPTPTTLLDAIRHYSNLDVCQQELVEARWPDGVECPTCGSKDVGYLANQRRWQCRSKHPRRQFSVKVGTIFEDSPIGLDKWFTAIWLIAGAKNGISSYEIHRALGVTQKTAWFMLHRIRLAMQSKSFTKMGGTVEVDETYIGGKARNMHASKRERLGLTQDRSMLGKVAVMGLLQRHGKDGHSNIRLEVVAGRKRHQLHPSIEKHVEAGATVHTDAHPSYVGLKFRVHPQRDRPRRKVRGRADSHERL